MIELAGNETIQMCTFRMAGRLFGVDIMDVKEVNGNIDITPIHHAPAIVCGYMNIRGQILLVVDLRRIFGFEASAHIEPSSKVVIFKPTVDEPFGILVDSVGDVVNVEKQLIVDRRTHESGEVTAQNRELRRARNELVLGVSPLEKELLLVLNARRILLSEKDLNVMVK
jgi:purine-binding chemotaxis protein CheW